MASTELRVVAQKALEALELAKLNGKAGLYPAEVEEITDAITALRAALVEDALQKFTDVSQEIEAALAEPVQEPVAWSYELATTMLEHGYDGWEHRITRYKPNVPEGSIRNLTPLYTTLRAALAEPVQEPVAWTYEWKHRLHGGSLNVSRARWPESDLWIETPLYAAPPQRKPLTVMELQDALMYTNLIDPDAVNDPEGYDEGSTLAQIDELHRRLTT